MKIKFILHGFLFHEERLKCPVCWASEKIIKNPQPNIEEYSEYLLAFISAPYYERVNKPSEISPWVNYILKKL